MVPPLSQSGIEHDPHKPLRMVWRLSKSLPYFRKTFQSVVNSRGRVLVASDGIPQSRRGKSWGIHWCEKPITVPISKVEKLVIFWLIKIQTFLWNRVPLNVQSGLTAGLTVTLVTFIVTRIVQILMKLLTLKPRRYWSRPSKLSSKSGPLLLIIVPTPPVLNSKIFFSYDINCNIDGITLSF